VAPTENPTTTTTPPQIEKSGDLPRTGISPNQWLGQIGLWILVAGITVWQISKGRRRGEYQLPRWLDEIDGE
jgi:LPXTG-motif cell wall-anchored protein